MSVQDAPTTVDLRKYIEVRLFGERSHVRGRRIPVAIIVRTMQANDLSVAKTAYHLSISAAEVLAALLYYQEHTDEIDQQEEEEARLFDEMKRLHGAG